MFCADKKIRFF